MPCRSFFLLALAACGSTRATPSSSSDGSSSDASGTDAAAVNPDAAACVFRPPNNGFAGSPYCPAMGATGQCWSGGYCNLVTGECCWRQPGLDESDPSTPSGTFPSRFRCGNVPTAVFAITCPVA